MCSRVRYCVLVHSQKFHPHKATTSQHSRALGSPHEQFNRGGSTVGPLATTIAPIMITADQHTPRSRSAVRRSKDCVRTFPCALLCASVLTKAPLARSGRAATSSHLQILARTRMDLANPCNTKCATSSIRLRVIVVVVVDVRAMLLAAVFTLRVWNSLVADRQDSR